jgi:RimJ/RimL family protein N-acetyltransferase
LSRHLFYVIDAERPLACSAARPEGYSAKIWKPARDGLPADPLPLRPFAIWWLFDRLRIFANRQVGVLMIQKGPHLVHRSLVTPRWYRFPDMGKDDLQIGDTWTHPDHRGKGLAKAAIAAIHDRWAGGHRRMWYLVGDDNRASVAVIEACGYRLAGVGERTRPFGLSPLGRFVIRDRRH